MGVDAHRSLRVSVGWSSTDEDIDAFLDALPRVTADLRRLGAHPADE
jgi:cysteine sulfinate desulfinase/cysteine desulfurase-like protein